VRSGVVLTRTRTQPGCAGTGVRLRRVDFKWRAGAPSTTRGAGVLPFQLDMPHGPGYGRIEISNSLVSRCFFIGLQSPII